MNRNRNQNILLVEIMIAVLFFALCSTVILETFMAARQYGRQSRTESAALTEMQNLAERVYAADDVEALLAACGYEQDDMGWGRNFGDFSLTLTLQEERTEAGMLRKTLIRAISGEKTIAEIPGARYLPGGEAE